MKSVSMLIKNSIVTFLICCYLLFYGIWLNGVNSAYVYNYSDTLFSWIAVSMAIQLFCFVYIKRVSIYDVGLWFLVLSYLFMYGFLFIDKFDMTIMLLWEPIKSYNQTTLFEATSFVNLCLNLFTLGYLNVNNARKEKHRINRINTTQISREKYYIGALLCVVGGICHLITSYRLITVTQSAGNYLAYTEAASTGIVDDISFLLVPGIIYILVSKKLNKTQALMLTGVVTAYFSLIMLLSGSRKTQVFGVVAVMLCYFSVYKPPKFSLLKKVFVISSGTVFLNMIYIIREYRSNLVEVVPAFFKSLTSFEFLRNVVPETLAETGITFGSVASVIKCVPDVFPYEYGLTIIRSVVSILPIGWLIPEFFEKAATTNTINKYLNLPVGGSLFADFYWNWSSFGIIAALVFGIILALVSSKTQKKSKEVYFSILYIVLIGVRAGMFEIARPLFVVLFVPWLISYFIKRIK